MKSAAAKGRKLFRLAAAALLATLVLAPQIATADAVGYPETRLRVFDLSGQVGDRVDSQLSHLSNSGYRHSYDENVVGSLLVPRTGGSRPAPALSTSAKGDLGEAAGRSPFLRAGYDELPGRLPGNRGFDSIFLKNGPNGPLDLVIVESKYASRGYASLTKTRTMGRQLSAEWIDANIRRLLTSGDPALIQTARLLRRHRSMIRIKANVLDPMGVNRWHRIRLPGQP